jgi:hypothetical protein
MRGPIIALTALVAAALAAAAPPELVDKGPVVAPVREPTSFTLKVDPKKKLGTAKTYDPKDLVVTRVWSDDPAAVEYQVFPKKQGTYYLPFWTDGEVGSLVVAVQAGGPTPEPPGPPTPPNPPVPPVAVGTWAVMIVNETAPDPKAVLVTDGPTARQLKADGKCRLYGTVSDAEKIAAKNYTHAMADAKVTPSCVLVFDDAGKVVTAFPLPATDPDLAAKLKGVLK